MTPEILIRSADPDDHAFIYSSWLKSYLVDRPDTQHLRADIYYPSQHRVITGVLASQPVLIATPVDQPGVILAYLVHGDAIVWYAYTKQPFRRLGLQRLLAGRAELLDGFSFNAFTRPGIAAVRNDPRAIYNPYLVMP